MLEDRQLDVSAKHLGSVAGSLVFDGDFSKSLSLSGDPWGDLLYWYIGYFQMVKHFNFPWLVKHAADHFPIPSQEMANHVRPKDCRASEKAKRSLGAASWLRSFLMGIPLASSSHG